MQRFARSRSFTYLVAVAAIVVATAASVGIQRIYPGTVLLLSVFFTGVAVASLYGGWGPGLLATVLSYLAANWFLVRPQDQFVFNGTVVIYFFVCLSIVSLSEAMRQALFRARASAQQTQAVLESMPDGFVAIDDYGRVTYMNPVANLLRGKHGNGNGGPLTSNDFPPTMGTVAEEKLREAARDHVTVEFEQYYEPWKQWFEVKASPGSTGGLVIYFRDITERKQAEGELRNLASIVDSSEDAIIGVDLEEKITTWNAGATRLFGYEDDEVIGKSIDILLPPELEDQQVDLLARVVREERFVHFDTVHLAKGGRRVHVSLSVSPIRDGSGRVVGLSKIARDITDRKRAEEMLREADRRKDNFLAVLGHELRNPLAGICNGVQVLNYVDSLPSDVVEIRDLIERQVEQMRRLIDDLLDVSRIARGKITLRIERVDLVALARQIADDYRARMREEQISFDVELPSEAIWIDGDPVRLVQVLGNLLDNAVKFSNPGGRVYFHVAPSKFDRHAIVIVRDTGAGLTPEIKSTLFEPFAQAEETLARSPSGLGLGLALVKGLVELHGGTVDAESEGPGRGTTFTAHFPRRVAPRAPSADADHNDQRVRGCRGLIIEDNPDVARPMTRLLELNGHQVAVAHDGLSGVDLAREFVPDIVFCDIGLPGEMDGYSVAKALRADSTTRKAFLVAVTGFGQEEDRRRAIEAGFNRHLTKPASHADLLAVLAEVAAARTHAGA